MIFEKILNETNNKNLGRLINQFSKDNGTPTPKQIDYIETQLSNPYYYVRQKAIEALLSRWQIKNGRIINKALRIVKNQEEDFDVRNSAISGLSVVYFNTGDLMLMKILFGVYSDTDEDDLIKESCFEAILNIYGISQTDILRKEYNFGFRSFSANLEDKEKIFFEELKKLRPT